MKDGRLQIVFGAGTKGRMLARLLGRRGDAGPVHCFVDGDAARWGEELENLPVRSPDYLQSLPRGSFRVHVAVGRGYGAVQRRLEHLGLREAEDFAPADLAPIPLAELDADFRRLRERLLGRTLLSEDRLQVLHQFARSVRHLPGAVAEVGVYRGGTALLLAEIFAATGQPLHLFDTFAGIPEGMEEVDMHRTGDFADTSLAAVRLLLEGFAQAHLHAGIFPESVDAEVSSERFCFVHVDADIHRSVADCCAFFAPRLVPGGMLLFDDYGFPSCPGVRRAVDAYCAGGGGEPIYLPTGQALLIAAPPDAPISH